METRERKVLITGSTGFIGRLFTRRLLDDGHVVRCMVRRDAAGIPDGAEIVRGDLLQPLTLGPVLEGIDNEVICRENAIREIIPLRLTPYDEAVRNALAADSVDKT